MSRMILFILLRDTISVRYPHVKVTVSGKVRGKLAVCLTNYHSVKTYGNVTSGLWRAFVTLAIARPVYLL
jgi:hypothetical protein